MKDGRGRTTTRETKHGQKSPSKCNFSSSLKFIFVINIYILLYYRVIYFIHNHIQF